MSARAVGAPKHHLGAEMQLALVTHSAGKSALEPSTSGMGPR